MTRPTRARVLLVIGATLALIAAVTVVMVPRTIKARIIDAARAHGVALSIDDLSITWGRARIKGVHASLLSDIGSTSRATASASTVDVELDFLTPKAVTIANMTADLDGKPTEILALVSTSQRIGATGTPSAVQRITITNATLTWKHIVSSERIAINATHLDGNVTRKSARALGEDWHFETPELHVFDAKDVAAWSATADSDATSTRASFVIGKAKATIDVASSGARSLEIDTPLATTKDLGLPAYVLGLYGDETTPFELHVHHEETDATHAKGALALRADNVFLGAATARTQIAIDARYAGDPKTSLKLASANLRAGPFTGALDGAFAIDPSVGFKASMRYASGIMSCADAVKVEAASHGEVGKGVAALASMLGLDRVVDGRIALKGEIEIDTVQNTRNFAFHTEGDCKLSYLPSP